MENDKKTTKLSGILFSGKMVGILLMLVGLFSGISYLYLTSHTLQSARQSTDQALDFMIAQWEKNKNQKNDAMISAEFELVKKAQVMQKYLMKSAKSLDLTELSDFVTQQGIDNYLVLDQQFEIIASRYPGTQDNQQWTAYLKKQSRYRDLFSYSNTVVSEAVKEEQTGDLQYVYAAVALRDHSGILVVRSIPNSFEKSLAQFSMTDLFNGLSMEGTGVALVTDDNEVLHATKQKWVGKQIDEFSNIHPGYFGEERGNMKRAFIDGKAYYGMYCAYKHYYFYVFFSEKQLFRERNADVAHFIVVYLAIFVIYLYLRQRQYYRYTAMMELSKEKAESANAAKTRFLSSISHDIRTPINAIMGLIDIAEKNREKPEILSDCFEKIRYSSNHLLLLINDVLDMRKLETNQVDLPKEPVDMDHLLEECETIIRGAIIDRDLDFVVQKHRLVHTIVYGSKIHIQQILVNILHNAVKYTPDGGKIVFEIREDRKEEHRVCYSFRIADTGIGMTQDFLEHIYEAFAQEKTGVLEAASGTGLGLAIVKQLVDLMQGQITVKSKKHVGTEFNIILPFEEAQQEQITEEETQAVRSDTSEQLSLEGKKILNVDDNAMNREIVEYMMRDAGVLYDTAKNGKEAVTLFEQSKTYEYFAILMDLQMPVMDGLQATKMIRSMSREDAATVPIIAVSANAFEQDVEQSLAAGMNSHIAKPINDKLLFDTMKSFLQP